MCDLTGITIEAFNKNPQNYTHIINNRWEEIPTLGSTIKEGDILKFRGMIQDMQNPDYYLSEYEVISKTTLKSEVRFGKYVDCLTYSDDEYIDFESDVNVHSERRPYNLISVPSVSHWAQVGIENNPESSVNYEELNPRLSFGANELKRSSDANEGDGSSKKLCSSISLKENIADPENKLLFNDPSNMACIVMMYDIPEDSLKLNEVIEVVGFAYQKPMSNDDDNVDDCLTSPCPLIPRLHMIAFRKLKNFNPLVPCINPSISEAVCNEAEVLRSDLHLALTQMLFGDAVAADYVICHLLAQIYHRDDSELVLGKLSLNISKVPGDNYGHEFFKLLSNLLPKVNYLPFNVENLNKIQLLPKKNYKSMALEQGILQLSDNTHLVIDETNLSEGKLEETGLRNVNTLRNLIKRQKLDYDFTYYNLGFATDIPVLILSQCPSILPSDAHIRLLPEDSSVSRLEDIFEAVNKFLSGPLLKSIRIYLTVCANLPFSLPEEFENVIQDDFVSLRQSDSSFTGSNLHELLVLSRFMSLSYGKSTLTKEVWDKTKALVAERKSRSPL